MKKLITAICLFIIILSGCSTTDGKTKETPSYDVVTVEQAFSVLMEDCFLSVEGYDSFTIQELSNLLDESVRSYEGYLPLYDSLLDSYLQKLQQVAEESSRWALGRLSSSDVQMPGDLTPYIGDDTLMGYIRTATYGKMYLQLSNHIPSIMGEADLQWNIFETECGIIKANYDNLNQLGYVLVLPDLKPVTASQLATLVLDRLYSALESTETYLKNRPLSENDDKAYSIFWQEV